MSTFITVVVFPPYFANIAWCLDMAFQRIAGCRGQGRCLLTFSTNETSSIFWDWFYSCFCCTKDQHCDLQSWGYSCWQDQFTCVFHTSCFPSCLIKRSIRLAPVKWFEFRHFWCPEQQSEEGKRCYQLSWPFFASFFFFLSFLLFIFDRFVVENCLNEKGTKG